MIHSSIHKHNHHFITSYKFYTPLSISLRFTVNSIIAILILKLVVYVGESESLRGPIFKDYILTILSFNLLSESHILIDSILERFLPIPEKLKLRFVLQTIISLMLMIVLFKLRLIIEPLDPTVNKYVIYFGFTLGMLFVSLIPTSLIVAHFMEKLITAQQKMDEMKQEKLRMDYSALQDQLNPHFLFNNLSVLKSLIIYDKDLALNFTENFTDVYRYVLKSKDKMLVEFRHERKFIDSFIGLHKERIGDGLKVKFSIEKEMLDKEIAPLTLQLLVENALKHNIASKENPLTIEIKTKDDYLIVENSLQLKEASYSTQTGLKNLINRYKIITDIDIEISSENEKFVVKVPFL